MKNFFTTLIAIFTSVIIFAGILTIVALFAMRDDKPKVESGSILVLNLNQPISDRPVSIDPQEFAQQLITGSGVSSTFTLRELIKTINHAAEDERISGLYLTGSVPTGGTYYSGTATLREFRDALMSFREAGKPIYAYNNSWNMRSYYLASAADSIFMHPFGTMSVSGYSTSRTYYKQALDRFGVKIYISREGAYKSALEPYFREQMSAEDREQRALILERAYEQFSGDVSVSRGIETEVIHALSSDPIMMSDAQAIFGAGFVDRVTYYDEVLTALRKFTGVEDESKPFTQINYGAYREAVGKKMFQKGKDKIALFYAEGGIVGGSGRSNVAGDYTARQLRSIRNDDKVKAVVLRVNSPGGGVYPSEVILREMRLLAEKKPVVVSMGNVAASGGYWISSYSDYIYANPTTITGSIGVYSMFPVIDDIASEYGFSFDSVKTHPFADLRTSERSPTPEEWAMIQGFTTGIYDDFLHRVSEGRSMDRGKVHEHAQGRVWSGLDALEIGLVDELGGLMDAIDKAVELAELDDWEIKTYEPAEDFRTRLLRQFGAGAKADASFETPTGISEKIWRALSFLNQLDDPNGIYARLPYDIIIE